MNIILNTDKTEAVIIGGTGPQGPIGPAGAAASFSESSEIDLTNKKDGSLLVYKALTDKWEATNRLAAQDIDSGEF